MAFKFYMSQKAKFVLSSSPSPSSAHSLTHTHTVYEIWITIDFFAPSPVCDIIHSGGESQRAFFCSPNSESKTHTFRKKADSFSISTTNRDISQNSMKSFLKIWKSSPNMCIIEEVCVCARLPVCECVILWYFMQISTEMNRNESNIVINQFLLQSAGSNMVISTLACPPAPLLVRPFHPHLNDAICHSTNKAWNQTYAKTIRLFVCGCVRDAKHCQSQTHSYKLL